MVSRFIRFIVTKYNRCGFIWITNTRREMEESIIAVPLMLERVEDERIWE